jgi:hypothetical protein
MRSAASILIAALALSGATRCMSVGQISNLEESQCRSSFSQAISSILLSQGEKPETADQLADRAVTELSLANLGPRPFLIASRSGTDYTFFVQVKGPACLLRLYGRQKGFWSYTNNLTYIETRPLPACACRDR